MTSRGKRLLTMVVALTLLIGVLVALNYRSLAIWSAPAKRKIATRTPAAMAADSVFWQTFHGADYDQIPHAVEMLARAYAATPNDPVTAGHLGWMHLWRIAEHVRNDTASAAIIEEMLLARRYFEESVRLDPSDPRTLGFLASVRMGEGSIQHDERLTRRGYFTMLDAIKAWPAFNLFTGGYVLSGAPANSAQFQEGLEWQWRDLDVCAGRKIDRTNPDFTSLLSQVHDVRACLDTWIAPHNAEGFFLNMGDMLVKAGDWRTARTIYANARLLPGYRTWAFAPVLERRIQDAEANVARFSGTDPDPKTGMMDGSSFSCMACHQQ
ncbi:MAG: hypothetical protein WBC97_06940 [Gemmatimonadales bacterium]